MLEAERRGHRGLRADAAGERPADGVGERREARVEALALQDVLGVLQATDGRADLRQKCVRLLGCVVALVEHLVSGHTHIRLGQTFLPQDYAKV